MIDILKDITLGQFFPGNSPIHRLDPRIKILLATILICLIFMIQNFMGYGWLLLFTLMCALVSKIPIVYMLKGVKPIMIFILITALFNIFMTTGTPIFQWGFLTITYEGVHLAILMIMRIFFLVICSSMLTLTTSPIDLTYGLERLLSPFKKIGVPAHELSMMMTIALRFIPTLLEETEKIMKAQSSRGADFESGSLLKRSKALIPILVPLFVSSFRRADDLAIAMECRCYHGGENRTRLKELKMHTVDLYAVLIMVAFTAGIVILNIFGII